MARIINFCTRLSQLTTAGLFRLRKFTTVLAEHGLHAYLRAQIWGRENETMDGHGFDLVARSMRVARDDGR